jgi:cytochrome c5
MRRFAILLAFIILLVGCIQETKVDSTTTTTLSIEAITEVFEETCSVCHSIDRPKSKQKTMAEWEETVKRMQDVNGARERANLTDEKAALIIDYLSANYGK